MSERASEETEKERRAAISGRGRGREEKGGGKGRRVGDEGVNSRKRRGEFNSRELARDEIAARRLVAGDLGHNYLNARGWINCCISHAKLILIHGLLPSLLPALLLYRAPRRRRVRRARRTRYFSLLVRFFARVSTIYPTK